MELLARKNVDVQIALAKTLRSIYMNGIYRSTDLIDRSPICRRHCSIRLRESLLAVVNEIRERKSEFAIYEKFLPEIVDWCEWTSKPIDHQWGTRSPPLSIRICGDLVYAEMNSEMNEIAAVLDDDDDDTPNPPGVCRLCFEYLVIRKTFFRCCE
jgi:hypothetical protein